jgi:hypothetical protein
VEGFIQVLGPVAAARGRDCQQARVSASSTLAMQYEETGLPGWLTRRCFQARGKTIAAISTHHMQNLCKQ